MSWVWQETGTGTAGGELHVNLRGYPGRSLIPTCTDTRLTASGKSRSVKLPCFADPNGHRRAAGIEATLYTVNQTPTSGTSSMHGAAAARSTR